MSSCLSQVVTPQSFRALAPLNQRFVSHIQTIRSGQPRGSNRSSWASCLYCVGEDRKRSRIVWLERLVGYGIIALWRKSIAHLRRPWRASYQSSSDTGFCRYDATTAPARQWPPRCAPLSANIAGKGSRIFASEMEFQHFANISSNATAGVSAGDFSVPHLGSPVAQNELAERQAVFNNRC
jgi:hypothetical protein